MLIAERLKDQMAACDLSQAALARKVGVSQQSIGRLVSGEAMGSRYLHKIATVLRTTPAYLTGETDDPAGDFRDDGLTSDEEELIELFRMLLPKDKAVVRQLIRSLGERLPSGSVHTPSRSYRA